MAIMRISALSEAEPLDGTELVEISQPSPTVAITGTTISALASDNSYNDSAAGFVAAGFVVGDRVTVSGFTGNVANNIVAGTVTAVVAGKLTIGGTDGDVIVDDAAGESVTIAKWTSRRANLADIVGIVSSYTDENARDAIGAALVGDGLSITVDDGGDTITIKHVGATPTTDSTTARTASLPDAGGFIEFTNASPVAFTIPPNSSVAFPIGTRIELRQGGAGVVTITPGVGVTLQSRAAAYASAGQFAICGVKKIATDTWGVMGDVA